jgi:hypothetical protein
LPAGTPFSGFVDVVDPSVEDAPDEDVPDEEAPDEDAPDEDVAPEEEAPPLLDEPPSPPPLPAPFPLLEQPANIPATTSAIATEEDVAVILQPYPTARLRHNGALIAAPASSRSPQAGSPSPCTRRRRTSLRAHW